METFGEHSPASGECLVQPERDPDRQPLHAAGEHGCVRCFAKEMEMVALDREVRQAEAEAVLAASEASAENGEAVPAAKVGDARDDL